MTQMPMLLLFVSARVLLDGTFSLGVSLIHAKLLVSYTYFHTLHTLQDK